MIVREIHFNRDEELPVSLGTLIRLVKVVFEWLYRKDLTDHIIEDQANAHLEP